MIEDVREEQATAPTLTFGRVDLVRVQIGYRDGPEGAPHQQFLLDLPMAETTGGGPVLDEESLLAALAPALAVGGDSPRHYSLHQHRSHTSWGASPGVWEIGLLVASSSPSRRVLAAEEDAVRAVFGRLQGSAGSFLASSPLRREAALTRARRAAAASFSVDPDALMLSAEQHLAGEESWSLLLRTTTGEEYDVVVGLVDGYAGSVRVRHRRRAEIVDAFGAE